MRNITLAERVYNLKKEHKTANEIAQLLGINFKQVMHLQNAKPYKVNGVRVWK